MNVATATSVYNRALAAYEAAAIQLRTALDAELLAKLDATIPNAEVRRVLEIVVRETEVCLAQIIGYDRHADVCAARYLAMHLGREVSGLSLTEIGRLFRRTHGDALQADRYIARMLPQDRAFAARYGRLRATLNLPLSRA